MPHTSSSREQLLETLLEYEMEIPEAEAAAAEAQRRYESARAEFEYLYNMNRRLTQQLARLQQQLEGRRPRRFY
ncbi:hypothetical protein JDV02_008937 [Purpureocillium takamizusanense]|uniref:Uncharacterized protein n=1 Tax=Purpureocillium takamizusanense TaxID=2060973 RepID=A0A9Q8QMZ7_9HYPO|nr:uncharacterized protein JDV02_008937 [Purpureocillium takamizusanense]UNI23098.1 hypothetical protein JDV02_008937 [Purpureocillium takamizusanense]